MVEEHCPLTPALRELLQACVDYETNRAEELARVLDKSPDTIRTEFQRVLSRMGLHDRGIAVTVALQRGWIRPRGSL